VNHFGYKPPGLGQLPPADMTFSMEEAWGATGKHSAPAPVHTRQVVVPGSGKSFSSPDRAESVWGHVERGSNIARDWADVFGSQETASAQAQNHQQPNAAAGSLPWYSMGAGAAPGGAAMAARSTSGGTPKWIWWVGGLGIVALGVGIYVTRRQAGS